MKYPPRFYFNNRPVVVRENASDSMIRCCPGCYRPLEWLIYSKLIRLDEPSRACEIADIVWLPEAKRWVVPRYREAAEPRCQMHGPVDWWLIIDRARGWIVGIASSEKGGKLAKRPREFTRRTLARIKSGRRCRWAGCWRERNIPQVSDVSSSQMRLI